MIGGLVDRKQRASELLAKLNIKDDQELLAMATRIQEHVSQPAPIPLRGISTEADGTQQLTYCKIKLGDVQIKFKPVKVGVKVGVSPLMPGILLGKICDLYIVCYTMTNALIVHLMLPVLLCY